MQNAIAFCDNVSRLAEPADWAAAAQRANKDLSVRGCVTHPSAAEAFYYDLHGARRRRNRRAARKARRRTRA